MAFTSWTELKEKMERDFAGASWRTKSYEFGNRKREFASWQDFEAAYAFVCTRAAMETGQLVKTGQAY